MYECMHAYIMNHDNGSLQAYQGINILGQHWNQVNITDADNPLTYRVIWVRPEFDPLNDQIL